ncbi:hypothetical protein H0I39_13225 [Ottowia beijingensis]|uniref:Uncharacterized protein n=1 Tax=Ottowia beijingensis TaxID=1207057 RepID=A0A853IYM3_9BURK|nr:hypothetical protein [Ottowia beijingensis]NZA02479.1 hypothetical protein [Ottowia beijingensis]
MAGVMAAQPPSSKGSEVISSSPAREQLSLGARNSTRPSKATMAERQGDLPNFFTIENAFSARSSGASSSFCNRQTPPNGYRLILPPQRPNMPRVPSIHAACGGKSPHSPLPAVVCAARARTHARWAPVRARAGPTGAAAHGGHNHPKHYR